MTVRLNLLTYAVLGFGVAGTFALVSMASDREAGNGPVSLLKYLWSALPYVVLALTARFLARTPVRRLVVLAGSIGTVLAGVGLILDEFVLRPEPDAAKMLLVLPAYQLVLAVGVLLVVSVLHLRRRVPPEA